MQRTYAKPMTNTEVRSLNVRQIMSKPAVTATEKTSIRDIARMMGKHRIDSVLITNKKNEPVGIITEGDIVKRLVSAKRNLWFVKAKHVMTKPVLTTAENVRLEDVAKHMANKRVKKLCVLDENGKVSGMVTTEDITKNAGYLIDVLEEIIETGAYMGEDSGEI